MATLRLSPSWRRLPVQSPIAPLSRVLFVDQTAANNGDGSIANPFNRIQFALDFIGTPVNLNDQNGAWEILVIGGTANEDLLIPSRRLIRIAGSAGNVDVGVIHSIEWIDDMSFDKGGTFAALALDGFAIAGGISLFDNNTPAQSILFLNGLTQVGLVDGTQHVNPGGFVAFGFYESIFGSGTEVHDINAPQSFILDARNASFVGDVSIGSLNGTLNNCKMGDQANARTFTVLGAPASTGFFCGCVFFGPGAGSYTLNAATPIAYQLDGTSNYFFKQGGVGALGGAASKVIVTDLTP